MLRTQTFSYPGKSEFRARIIEAPPTSNSWKWSIGVVPTTFSTKPGVHATLCIGGAGRGWGYVGGTGKLYHNDVIDAKVIKEFKIAMRKRKKNKDADAESEDPASQLNAEFDFDIDFDEDDDDLEVDETDPVEQQMARLEMLLGLVPPSLLTKETRDVLLKLAFPLVTLARGAVGEADPAKSLLGLFVQEVRKDTEDTGDSSTNLTDLLEEHKLEVHKGLLDVGTARSSRST